MSSELKSQYEKTYGSSYSPQEPDYSRCAESVHDRYASGFYQCRRKNGHGPHGAWCKQHDPEAVKKRRAEQQAKWNEEWAESRAKHKQAKDDARLRPIYEAALRKIANGSNDPRSEALTALTHIGEEE